MNFSTLKILVPVVLLMGIVFALTFFAQYKPPEDDGGKEQQVITEKKPLQFFTSRRMWMPVGGSLQDSVFPGYFEPGETTYTASFWFANRNAAPVRMQLKSVSCSTCSGGQVAPIPVEVTKQILQMTAISALPQGLVAGFPIGLAAPAAQLDAKRDTLKWQHHMFSKAPNEVVYAVPGAPDADEKWGEQWAILDLQFKVKPGGRGALTTYISTQVQGEEGLFDEKFEIVYMSAAPFDLEKSAIDIGELTDASGTQRHEVLVYSSTRTPAQLPTLDISVAMPPGTSGEPGPFVSTEPLIPIPESRLVEYAIRLSQGQPQPVRVNSAFWLPIVVKTKVGEAKLDIGRVDRVINLTQGSDTKQIRVSGSMRGPIYLAGSREISFGNFAYAKEQSVSVMVETDRAGVELEIVKELTQPKFLQVRLEKLPNIGDRGSYRLQATLPGREQLGEIKDGVVVLEAKGPNPQRLRIPVSGRGR